MSSPNQNYACQNRRYINPVYVPVRRRGSALDAQIQKLRLIVNGAVCLYEGQGLEIPELLKAQHRDDLLGVLDAIVAALYWMQEELTVGE